MISANISWNPNWPPQFLVKFFQLPRSMYSRSCGSIRLMSRVPPNMTSSPDLKLRSLAILTWWMAMLSRKASGTKPISPKMGQFVYWKPASGGRLLAGARAAHRPRAKAAAANADRDLTGLTPARRDNLVSTYSTTAALTASTTEALLAMSCCCCWRICNQTLVLRASSSGFSEPQRVSALMSGSFFAVRVGVAVAAAGASLE
jgi:hypothetical protein